MERKTFGDAIVIGGSMAGLLAARVLADYFTTVTVIERDEPSEQPEPRRGVPQGRHAHGLLLRGQDTICRLFRDVREELLAAGATPVNMGRDMKWFHFGVWKCRYHSALDFISASRPLIEWTIAERVRRLPNVKMLHGWSVESVIYDGHSVSGVRMHRRDDREAEQRLARGPRDRRQRARLADSAAAARARLRAPGGVDGADRRRLCHLPVPHARDAARLEGAVRRRRSRRRSAAR